MIHVIAFIRTLVLLLLIKHHVAVGVKLSLDASDVLEEENQKFLYTYHVLSHLNHLATNTFKLRLNPKAKADLEFLKNVTKTGLSYDGLKDFPNKSDVEKNALKGSKLSEESQLLLQALTQKNLKIPIVLKPADDDLTEFLKFMDAFKEYWAEVDSIASLEIETLGHHQELPPAIKDAIANRTRKSSSTNRSREDKALDTDPISNYLEVSESNLKTILQEVLKEPRNHETSKVEKVISQAYITMKFEDFGLAVYNHEFSAHETEYLYGKPVIGTNVIGILTGNLWGSPEDSPIIIGAHYDTVPGTSGVIDNASGTAALIEAARMLSSSGCSFNNSIFFVAFDLEEIGTQGSFMFVKDILLKLIFPAYGITSISGALIMDCVGNWDVSEDSQDVPEAWEEKLPGLKKNLKTRNNTGDFLAVMYRENPDGKLAERVKHYYVGLNESEFRVELLPLKELQHTRPNDTVNIGNFDFFRSDHYRFWYPSEKIPNISFPAVLLTDTGPYRGKMKECYHKSCDNFQEMQPNIKFLAKITKTAAWVAADLSQATCGQKVNLSISELFRDVMENGNRNASEQNLSSERPMISISGLLEILHYLGKMNPNKLEQALNIIRSNISKYSLPNSPNSSDHRFNIPQENKIKNSNSTSKLSITIHGKDSTFLIPLRIFHTNDDKFHGNNVTVSTNDKSDKNNLTNSVNNNSGNLSKKLIVSSSIGIKHVRRTTKRNPLETDVGTSLSVH